MTATSRIKLAACAVGAVAALGLSAVAHAGPMIRFFIPNTSISPGIPPDMVPEFLKDPSGTTFGDALGAKGKQPKDFIDFRQADPGPMIPNPLDENNQTIFPSGQDFIDNLTFESNDFDGDGAVGLQLTPFTAGFGLTNSDAGDMLRILSGPPAGDNHTAFLIQVGSTSGAVGVTVTLKDGTSMMAPAAGIPALPPPGAAPPPGMGWFGVLVNNGTIESITISDPGGGMAGPLFVQPYIPAPGVASLLALAGVATARRRRR